MNFNEDQLALCAPIRKPRNKLRDQCKAHRLMALNSLDRMLQIDGRLFWVEFRPSFDELAKLLHRMSSDGWAELPRNQKGECSSRLLVQREVTRSLLNELNHSISRWSAWLESATDRRNHSASFAKRRAELKCVVQRQTFLFSSAADASSCQQFLLDQNQTLEFEALFSKAQYVARIWSPAMRNLGRFVYWCGGSDAFTRFATAMNRAPRSSFQKCRKQLNRAVHWTESLQKRLRSEFKLSVGHDLDNNDLNNELHEWMQLRNLKHSVRGKLPHRLKHARENYVSAQKLVSDKVERLLPATIAAWAICTKSGHELPQYQIDRAFEIEAPTENYLKHFANVQIKLSESASYPRLVEFMNQYTLVYSNANGLRWALRCLEQGSQYSDIKYLLDNDLEGFSSEKLGLIRQASQRYMFVFGARVRHGQFAELIESPETLFPVEAVEKVVRWLEMFPEKLFTRGLCERIHGVLRSLVQLAKVKPMQHEIALLLTSWSNRSRQIRDCFPNESVLPQELRSWLRRLTYFQRLSDSEVRIPSSLMKLLEGPRRESRELGYLETLEEHGQLNHKQLCRLKSLRSKSSGQERVDKNAILLTMELCVLSAIESLRKLLMKPVQRVWIDMTGGEMPADWSDQRCIEYADWVQRMEPAEKHYFHQTFAAFREHGAVAKSKLLFNQKWIDQQCRLGFKLDLWLSSTSESFSVSGESFRVGICNDPEQVLLMGTLFNTCLSPGGCNEMSVLSNIAHANKQVLYVWNSQNQIVSRKLLSVSRDHGLLGYAFYQQVFEIDGKVRSDEISSYVSAFCGRLAARVGWKLVNSGEPQSLGHFWYDDGEVDWEKAAKDAWSAELAASR